MTTIKISGSVTGPLIAPVITNLTFNGGGSGATAAVNIPNKTYMLGGQFKSAGTYNLQYIVTIQNTNTVPLNVTFTATNSGGDVVIPSNDQPLGPGADATFTFQVRVTAVPGVNYAPTDASFNIEFAPVP